MNLRPIKQKSPNLFILVINTGQIFSLLDPTVEMASRLFALAARYLPLKMVDVRGHLNHLRNKASNANAVSQHSPAVDISDLRIMLLCNQENGLTKLVKLILQQRGAEVKTHEVESSEALLERSNREDYHLIVCPFLTKRVPKDIWENTEKPCLIVHPGIAGDRGMSSLDWAIKENQPSWGVTVLQAAEEMDAGSIWSTVEFPVPKNSTKTGLYNGSVADNAMEAVIDAVERFKLGVPPRDLDYSDPDVRGTLKSRMTYKERCLDWNVPADIIVRKIRMSDTQPGCKARPSNLGRDVIVFGGHVQERTQSTEIQQLLDASSVGDIAAQKHGAVLLKSGDGNGVWITHMKVGFIFVLHLAPTQ